MDFETQNEIKKPGPLIRMGRFLIGVVGFLAFAYLFFGTIDSVMAKSRCDDPGKFWLARPFGNRMAVGGWDYEAREGTYKDLEKKRYVWGYCIQNK